MDCFTGLGFSARLPEIDKRNSEIKAVRQALRVCAVPPALAEDPETGMSTALIPAKKRGRALLPGPVNSQFNRPQFEER
jgi:hypothetical protein